MMQTTIERVTLIDRFESRSSSTSCRGFIRLNPAQAVASPENDRRKRASVVKKKNGVKMGLENRVALVTGAASEIGHAYVKYLLRNRVKVLLCDVNVEKCQRIVDDFARRFRNVSAYAVKCDVTVEDEFENAFKTCMKHFGRLDIVINNAGVFDYNSKERWSTTVNINYGGIVRGTLLAIKYMGLPNGGSGGTVIQTTSLMAYTDGFHYSPMYKTTRKCVIEFTTNFGAKRNFSLHGVRMMSLCPGFTGNGSYAGPSSATCTNKEVQDNGENNTRDLYASNGQPTVQKT